MALEEPYVHCSVLFGVGLAQEILKLVEEEALSLQRLLHGRRVVFVAARPVVQSSNKFRHGDAIAVWRNFKDLQFQELGVFLLLRRTAFGNELQTADIVVILAQFVEQAFDSAEVGVNFVQNEYDVVDDGFQIVDPRYQITGHRCSRIRKVQLDERNLHDLRLVSV